MILPVDKIIIEDFRISRRGTGNLVYEGFFLSCLHFKEGEAERSEFPSREQNCTEQVRAWVGKCVQ